MQQGLVFTVCMHTTFKGAQFFLLKKEWNLNNLTGLPANLSKFFPS